MKVLVACEFSGIVRDAFVKKGHYAISCDLIPSESPGEHYLGDVLDIIDEGWDMMIAHPPCTYLSNAGAMWLCSNGNLNQERYEKWMEGARFFMKLYNANIPKICIENPMPSVIFGLPKKTQVIQPYFFGHPYSKRTYLWLKNLPPLVPTNNLGGGESTKYSSWFNSGGKERPRKRSKTFLGVAGAMAEQWG